MYFRHFWSDLGCPKDNWAKKSFGALASCFIFLCLWDLGGCKDSVWFCIWVALVVIVVVSSRCFIMLFHYVVVVILSVGVLLPVALLLSLSGVLCWDSCWSGFVLVLIVSHVCCSFRCCFWCCCLGSGLWGCVFWLTALLSSCRGATIDSKNDLGEIRHIAQKRRFRLRTPVSEGAVKIAFG